MLGVATQHDRILIMEAKPIRKTNADLSVKNLLKTVETKRGNNMYKSVLMSFTAILLCAGVALANGSGPATKTVEIKLKGTGGGSTAGQCTSSGDSWLDDYTCPSGNCSCSEITNPTISGSKLKSVSNFFVTNDTGINPATEPAVGTGPTPKCDLLLGTFTATDSSGKVATINFLGVSCNKVTGLTKNNPSGNDNQTLLSGGWGISDTPAPTPTPISGWGTFTGTSNKNTNAVSMKLSGWRTK